MPGNPRGMISVAEQRFPVRIRVGVAPEGLGHRHARITAWLDENCGLDGWTMTPSGTRGVLSDALSIYFADTTAASAFVARWCVGATVETRGPVPTTSGLARAATGFATAQDTVSAPCGGRLLCLTHMQS